MKKLFFPLIAFFLTTTLFAQKDFEGIIKIESDDADQLNATFYVKGDNVRMEASNPDAQPVIMIINNESGEVITLSEQNGQKNASRLNLNDIPESLLSEPAQIAPEIKFTVTNETKKIDGYKCKKVIGSNAETSAEAWINGELNLTTKDLFPLSKNMSGGIADLQEIKDAEGLVMEMTVKDLETGKVVTTKSSIKEKRLDDKLFQIPADYKIADLGKIMEMMGNMPDKDKMKEIQDKVKQYQKQAAEQQQKAMPAEQQKKQQ